jgi:hypothetical protein
LPEVAEEVTANEFDFFGVTDISGFDEAYPPAPQRGTMAANGIRAFRLRRGYGGRARGPPSRENGGRFLGGLPGVVALTDSRSTPG